MRHSDTAPGERRRDDTRVSADTTSIADGASLLSMARAIRRTPTDVLEAQHRELAGLPIGPRWQSLDRLYLIRRELRRRAVGS